MLRLVHCVSHQTSLAGWSWYDVAGGARWRDADAIIAAASFLADMRVEICSVSKRINLGLDFTDLLIPVWASEWLGAWKMVDEVKSKVARGSLEMWLPCFDS